ncbi:NAD-dependent succinate-semialdehyde dehydrogenase [Pedomonas mirosovicensis]|uniref:NAD-dependent succinate-semialdehyde dehydrogenase n=1 Tax=Pedomonas mirosovicensis TaxID=2908641 RepID=UPI002167AE99|nr:NAD-dependent succinate-semialdehyde dehydrogenase [Pedomonas mirosovicensis]MCH8684802.1 NAD-dependent succinate-semialdehyde dehydrogenase [Pedomonas mirosovicensis]
MDVATLRKAYVDGAWVDGTARFEVTNPATGEVLAHVPDLGAEETKQAIDAAHRAFPAWAAKTAKERSQILRRWFDLIISNAESLARLMTLEQGKPIAESRGEVAYGASFIEWFAEEAKRVYGDVIPTTAGSKRYLTIRQPIGVVAAITPWNFPIAMITRKAGPALAAGCTMVLKPPSETPLCALELARLAEEAGLPAGVLNIVTTTDSKTVGKVLCESPIVKALSFTGSTEVGKILYKQCADTVKKLGLELGGNAPLIVFDDADLAQAVEGTLASKYRNAGQTCVCANRILVQSGIYDAFAQKLAERVAAMKVGNGLEEGVTVGPLISEDGLAKVERLVEDALKGGAKAITGATRAPMGGLFYEPTVLTDATDQMALFEEEIFGPVAPLFRFETDEDGIRMANNTQYGLAAYIFTRDVNRVVKVSEALEYGMVGVNDGILSSEVVPFGGVKESGLGREGGHEGLEEFLETKYICLGGLDR